MAGTLNVTTITDGSASINATNLINGAAKAWVNFNSASGSPVIRASFNVGSVTRNGAGDYTINFSTAFADVNYVTVCGNADTSTGGSALKVLTTGGYNGTLLNYSTSGVRVGGSGTDFTYAAVACFR